MVCLSEEGAIINEPPFQRERELAPWRRRRREMYNRCTRRLGTGQSKENALEPAHVGSLMP